MKTTLILAISGLASAGQIANPFLQPRQYVQDLSATPTIEGQTECLPPNYPCGNSNICVIVSRGDTCCPESYVCPPFDDGTGSFCLTNNKCCPVGEDPATCARREGVSLPPGFQVGGTYQSASASASASVSLPTLSTSIETDTGAPTFSVSLPTLSTSIPAGTGTGIGTGTGTGVVPTATSTSTAPIVPFTGGAGRVGAGGYGGIVVAVLAGVGMWFV